MVRAVMPFVDNFDKGAAGFDVEDLTFVGRDSEFAPEDDGRVDERMFVHGQTLARRNGDLKDADLRFAGWIGGKLLAGPGLGRNDEFFPTGSGFVLGEKAEREKEQKENG